MCIVSGVILLYLLIVLARFIEMMIFVRFDSLNGLGKISRECDEAIYLLKFLRGDSVKFQEKIRETNLLLVKYSRMVDKFGKINIGVCFNPLISIRGLFPVKDD